MDLFVGFPVSGKLTTFGMLNVKLYGTKTAHKEMVLSLMTTLQKLLSSSIGDWLILFVHLSIS